MRQSLIAFKFLVDAQCNSLRLHQLYYKLLVLNIKHSMWVFWETLPPWERYYITLSLIWLILFWCLILIISFLMTIAWEKNLSQFFFSKSRLHHIKYKRVINRLLKVSCPRSVTSILMYISDLGKKTIDNL